jgi:uncharacterized membrane protein
VSDVRFDDPAGRTRFAWARTLMVTFVVSLLVERLLFSQSPWRSALLVLPVGVVGFLTLLRSQPLRRDAPGIPQVIPVVVLSCVLVIAIAAIVGVAESL